MDQSEPDVEGSLDDLVAGYFRYHERLKERTREDLKRGYIPVRPPDPDALLFQWLSDSILHARTNDAPERAWPVILELVQRAPDDEALIFIGADALEDFVRQWGALFESRIVDQAARDEQFRKALASVWENSETPPALAEAIRHARELTGIR